MATSTRRRTALAVTAAAVALALIPLTAGRVRAEEPRVLSASWRGAMVAIGKAVEPKPADVRGGASTTAAPADGPAASAPADPTRCALLLPASDLATSADCLACHGRLGHGGHPYDLEYARWGSGAPVALRARDEAIRRGVFLPDQQVRCVTCHDRTSPWKYNLRVPRDAKVAHAVDRRRPATYETPRALPAPKAGDDIGRKPLCLGCHAMD